MIRLCGRIALQERIGTEYKKEVEDIKKILLKNSFHWKKEDGQLFSLVIQGLLIQTEEDIKNLNRRNEYEQRADFGRMGYSIGGGSGVQRFGIRPL